MKFFLILSKDNKSLTISPFPEQEQEGSGYYLEPGLPLSVLSSIIQKLKKPKPSKLANLCNLSNLNRTKLSKEKILNELNKEEWSNNFKLAWKPIINNLNSQKEKLVTEEKLEKIKFLKRGRLITENDFSRLANEYKIDKIDIERIFHQSVTYGLGEWVTAVTKEGNSWTCQRCGNKEFREWPSVFGPAVTCENCASLGPLTSFQVIYRDFGISAAPEKEIKFKPYWPLTPAQEQASLEIVNFVNNEEEREALLWAACGAGKTEVCFPAAALALSQGKSVLFAAPRQDVVLDVEPRLKRDFPDLEIAVYTGTIPSKFQPGSLVLATTHQLLRFNQAFDLIFLDEIDAYPYYGNRMLEWGVKQARKRQGKILFLTATPSWEHLQEIRQAQKRLIRLPARHHKHSLPVPKWKKVSYPDFPSCCPEDLKETLIDLLHKGTIIFFVPKISWVEFWVNILKLSLPEWEIDGSFSRDPKRREKINGLREGRYNLFVSTSILERGVTIPNVQVAVFAADHSVFNERALVQMAGRAGRTVENPEGDVIFLAKHNTTAMEKAVTLIREQNDLAKAMGLIN